MNRLTCGIIDRVDPALHQVVKRPDQNRHDRKLPALAQQVLQENNLKFDRMLGAMRQLIVEIITAAECRDPVDVSSIGRHEAQRRLEIFGGQRKPPLAVLMRHAQNHEDIGLGVFDELLVRPGVNRSPAVKVDMRTQDPANARRCRSRHRLAADRRQSSRRKTARAAPGANGASPRKIGPPSAAGRRPDSRYDW